MFFLRQDGGGVIGGGFVFGIGVGGRMRGLVSTLEEATVDDVGSVDKVAKLSVPSSSFICLLGASFEAVGRCGLGTVVSFVLLLLSLCLVTQLGHCQPCHVTSVSRKHCLIHSMSSFLTAGGKTPCVSFLGQVGPKRQRPLRWYMAQREVPPHLGMEAERGLNTVP